MENWSLTISVGFLVWMSGSLCLIHPSPLHLTLSLLHIYFYSSPECWLLLNRFSSSYTTQHRVRTERFLSTIQIYLANSSRPPPFSYIAAIFRPCFIHVFCFFRTFSNVRRSRVDCCVIYICQWHVFLFPFLILPCCRRLLTWIMWRHCH